jgi:alcohol dehydrogenase
LAALLGALAAGAQPVLAIDPSAEKRARTLELGAAMASRQKMPNRCRRPTS